MINNSTIGVMDSGVGGLSILNELKAQMPNADYLYLGDTANLPYGSKTKEEILFFNRNILNYFIRQGVKTIAIACNTTSALTFDELKTEFEPKGLKIFPLIQCVANSIVEDLNDGDCVCVFATLATVKSGKYGEVIRQINPKIDVLELACPGFVEIVENRLYETPEAKKMIEEKMRIALAAGAKKIVLGCTHYPYLIDLFSKYAPKEIFFNPASAMAKNVRLALGNIKGNGSVKFCATKNPEEFIKSAKFFFDIKDGVQLVKLPEYSTL